MRLKAALSVLIVAVFVSAIPAAQTLPAQLTDTEFWKIVSEFSEPDGFFQYEIVTSNELSYQQVMPALTKTGRTGGAYLGVGPEQNFTYIAALQPKIAFIIDIRRDMMLEHLMYKSVFEMSADRVEFVANLFARKSLAKLTAESPVDILFEAIARIPADSAFAEDRFNAIMTNLRKRHGFPVTAADEQRIRAIYMTFIREGVRNFYASFRSPGYATLMTLTDGYGKNWSFLASKTNYDRVRAMQQKNLIVPLTGDFAGRKTLRMTGQYLKDRGTTVNAFYISNVEDYIGYSWPLYTENIASLPVDASSMFIRWSTRSYTSLASIADFIRAERPRR